ncbi:MAG: restriction endonuclease subunit S, partial [Lachnospiraceae bacterium]|nr:restriction endonuclease subunit S [Lachnospiraceae bacterium]
FGSINRKDIEDIDVEIPKEIKNQIKISTILKEIDDKIELNNKINKNLRD